VKNTKQKTPNTKQNNTKQKTKNKKTQNKTTPNKKQKNTKQNNTKQKTKNKKHKTKNKPTQNKTTPELMRFKYSKHALEQMRIRKIHMVTVDDVLKHPDKQIADQTGLSVYQKTIQVGEKYYLYRVFVNHHKNPPLVVTVYKTSKLNKYED
jgi:hypothetical protein